MNEIIDPATRRLERRALLLMALVQFIGIWDFMIVMPMGPDFAHALHIDAAHNGWIAGSYSIAAALAGIIAVRFIDRFDRKSVLMTGLAGLSMATALSPLADTLEKLITVRMLTGLFGGPLMATSMAVIADIFPPQRRGQAMGKVMGSFSLAAVIGVPLGLAIAYHTTWWAPFTAVALVGLVTMLGIAKLLPSMRGHITDGANKRPSIGHLLSDPAAILCILLMGSSMLAAFLIIPNISAHVQYNLGYPRDGLGMLYMVGGVAAFFIMRLTGLAIDRKGPLMVSIYATLVLVAVLWAGFIEVQPELPVMVIFTLYMMSMSARNVTGQFVASRVPQPHERAGFMAMLSAFQNMSTGLGAYIGGSLLQQQGDKLVGMPRAGMLAAALALVMPFGIAAIKKLKKW